MYAVNHLEGFGTLLESGAKVTFLGSATPKTSGATSFTFSSQSFGQTVPAGAVLVMCLTSDASGANRNYNGCTVNGNAASPNAVSPNGLTMVGIYQYVAPSDMSSATIVVSSNGTAGGCTLDMFMLENLQSTTPIGTFVTTGTTPANSDPTTTFSPTDTGNVAIAVALNIGTGAITWIGLDVQATQAMNVFAAHVATAAMGNDLETLIAITADCATPNRPRMAAAYWR
ncbi:MULTISPECIES: hypothetical protein [Kaistia]|uniref:Uncharacterized protein n=1 Tax=Kaistia nematophila TaxID=2994654 RepID=A0A9X3IN74_9HYPH|nr:hypothetical protein [Kaistia nematophila]MCX5570635.1 hypothetical protein [Kaistia nematophila]